MQFNETKSKAMLTTRKRRHDDINIILNNRRLEHVTEIKYLGIHFDSRLTFSRHIGHITEKSRKLIYTLSKTAKLNWGLGHKSLKTIYERALVPLMTYGTPVWEKAVSKTRNLVKLQSTEANKYQNRESVQDGVFRSFMHVSRGTIYRNINRGKGETVQNYAQYRTRRTRMRTTTASQGMASSCPATELYFTVIYTDGSKIGDKVGARAAIYRDQELIKRCKYKLKNCCSNNQAQQLAILKSLEELSSLPDHKDRTVAIYTDSQVTIEYLRNNSIHTPIIVYIREMYNN